MTKTLVGIVTFGNFSFTKLGIEAVEETTSKPYDFLIIVGKPGDDETVAYLVSKGIPHIVHDNNYGFPYSLNDIYQKAFEHGEYDNLIIMGNDVIPYPTTIDAMIELADESDYGWISACQYDVRGLVRDFPETASCFDVDRNYAFTDFDSKPWEMVKDYDRVKTPTLPGLSDIHNLALYKKIVYDKIGYVDVNFYPAYYSDNDYARRGVNAKLGDVSCTLVGALYFHFWSRTIHQGSGGSTHNFFNKNKWFYTVKWGGDFGSEKYTVPFGGKSLELFPGVVLEPSINISSRELERQIVNYWRLLP